MKITANDIEQSLKNLGVVGRVMGVKTGPLLTVYEFEPEPGVRMAEVIGTAPYLTKVLNTDDILIGYIPRTTLFNIQIPNKERSVVSLQNLLNNPGFENSSYELPIVLGTDVYGTPVYGDLNGLQHILIGGRVGSGKTYLIKNIMFSLTKKLNPDELNFIVIDTKGVDFNKFNNFEYLSKPIIHNGEDAIDTLQELCTEVDNRFVRLADSGAVDVKEYNHKNAEKMHRIVVVIDELVDLINNNKNQTEEVIKYICERSGCVGIHIIAASQRTDDLTEVIKAYFPEKMAFQARHKEECINFLGADELSERLLSYGDMLFSNAGRQPIRINTAHDEFQEFGALANG